MDDETKCYIDACIQDSIRKAYVRDRVITYIGWVIIFIGLLFTCKASKANAMTYEECQIEIAFSPTPEALKMAVESYIAQFESLTEQQRKEFLKKADDHRKKGLKAYGEAKEICWCLPSLSDIDKAKTCFAAGAAMINTGTPYSKIVSSVVVMLTAYGLACLDSWNRINTKMYEAQHHFEMHEFYIQAIMKG